MKNKLSKVGAYLIAISNALIYFIYLQIIVGLFYFFINYFNLIDFKLILTFIFLVGIINVFIIIYIAGALEKAGEALNSIDNKDIDVNEIETR